jgi:microsomal dipeptidase-like Zn-dependent dipeptidase
VRTLALALATCTALLCALAGGAAARPVYNLAGRCVALHSLESGRDVGSFYFKATGLGTYLLEDTSGQLLKVVNFATIGRGPDADRFAEWAPDRLKSGRYEIRSTVQRRRLSVAAGSGELGLGGIGQSAQFTIAAGSGCKVFPEAGLNATGGPARGHGRTVSGFVDAHLHITADRRAGGRVIHGEAFDRFGIPTALGGDALDHGDDGSKDVTGNLLRTGLPFGGHDTHGWPTFSGWPTHDTNTHQQTYYVWLERAWMAGERLVVAQTVDDAAICRIEPLKRGSCDETRSIRAQIKRLRALQNYVDAQSGGPGRGWFRIVTTPAQARRVIRAGKLAVVLGIESSDLFGCSERGGRAQCSKRGIDRGLRSYRKLGVRGVFVAHWVNNALAGAALEGGAKGAFINVFNRVQTGAYFKTGRCPSASQGEEVRSLSKVELGVLAQFFPSTKPLASEGMPSYPAGKQCNTRGLTPLGRYAIRKLMRAHMLIEVDHMSERARDEVLKIAARNRYPLVSSHNGTGGEWTSAELRKLRALGGFAAVTPDTATQLATKIRRMSRFGFFGVGLGTDTGGFASLPGARSDAASSPLPYPFRSYDGRVTFQREQTGERSFDLNSDGVAHYGLFADLLADTQYRSGRKSLAPLFRSAEAYLRTWQLAFRRG